jgi:hypothetical protein
MTTTKIRDLNDAFRRSGVGGKVLLTNGVNALGMDKVNLLNARVREFASFPKGNDPYGEHDFGAVTFEGTKYFWKIDYYALDMQHGSEDPADPSQTTRVLTIMRADEY